jgi:cytochrome c peroxidase
MTHRTFALGALAGAVGLALATSSIAQRRQQTAPVEPARAPTSYAPTIPDRPFNEIFRDMSANKANVMREARALLEQRYDMSDRPVPGITMSRGKPVQGGVRVRLQDGVTWQQLSEMTRQEIAERGLFPDGFKPLPHPFHAEGGMVFPQNHIDEILEQEQRNLNRFDVELDVPEHFLAEFPPPIYLTTRPELGDVSQGQLVTTQNFFELFDGILNPKQLEGLRLLVSPFPQQQFNLTSDRRSERPSLGVTASIATRTDTRTARRTWSATFGRRRCAGGSMCRPCAALLNSDCLARSARYAPSRTSRSSSSARRTSTATS